MCLKLSEKVYFKEIAKPMIDKGFRWEYINLKNHSILQKKKDLIGVCSKCSNNLQKEMAKPVEERTFENRTHYESVYGQNFKNFSGLRFGHKDLDQMILDALRPMPFLRNVDYTNPVETGMYPLRRTAYNYYNLKPDFFLPY